MNAHRRELEAAERHGRHSPRDQPARADAVGELAGDRREDDDQDRPGKERRTRLDRRPAQEALHVDREEDKDPEHREGDEDRDDVRTGERPVTEQSQVEHRQPLAELDEDEGGERNGGDDEEGEDPRRRPPEVVRLDQRVDQRKQANPGGEQAGQVEPLLVRGIPRLRHDDDARDDAENPDRDVDVEDPVPGDVRGDDSAEERSDRERHRRDAGPDPDCRPALTRCEGCADD